MVVNKQARCKNLYVFAHKDLSLGSSWLSSIETEPFDESAAVGTHAAKFPSLSIHIAFVRYVVAATSP